MKLEGNGRWPEWAHSAARPRDDSASPPILATRENRMTEPASGTAATGTTGTAVPPAGTYTLDPDQTIVRADVRAMFGLFTVHGMFRLKSGQVSIAADPAGSSVRAIIDATSWTSGNATRDADVTSPGLLDAHGFPEITFTGRGARPDGSGWVVPGSVTAHGTPAQAEVRIGQPQVEGG